MEQPTIGVVIVTWNNESEIESCLTSLKNQTYPNLKIILVDNASKDQTIDKAAKSFPGIDYIIQKKNYYLCKSNNDGIKHLWEQYHCEYVMVLNPDTKLEDNTIENLHAKIATDESIGAVGPKILFWNNKYEGKINSAGLVFDGFMHAYDRGFQQDDKGQFDTSEEVQGLSGACILYRSSALKKTGLYWEPLKMYLDDVELGIRLRKNKFTIIYEPKAIIHHSYMASTNQNQKFSVSKQQKWAWLLIGLRHYKPVSKLAMIKKYLFK